MNENIKNCSDGHPKLKELFISGVTQLSRTRETQHKWWRDCYHPREDKRNLFVSGFLDNTNKSICRLTGQLGSGKTSFILDKIQNPDGRVCDGIYVDIGAYSLKLGYGDSVGDEASGETSVDDAFPQNAEQTAEVGQVDKGDSATVLKRPDISGKLDEIIATTIRKLFDDHFWHLETGMDDVWFAFDVTHRLNVKVIEPTETQLLTRAEHVQRKSRSAFVLVSPDPELVKIRTEAFAALPQNAGIDFGEIGRAHV